MLEHNRDRGKIKWTAMMLPEHISLLREWQAEDDYVKRPELSEWDLENIQEELERGLKMKCQTLVEICATARSRSIKVQLNPSIYIQDASSCRIRLIWNESNLRILWVCKFYIEHKESTLSL